MRLKLETTYTKPTFLYFKTFTILKILLNWPPCHHKNSRKCISNVMPTKVRLVKPMVFPVVMYGCESWTMKKAELRRIDAFELCCWKSLFLFCNSSPASPPTTVYFLSCSLGCSTRYFFLAAA